MGITTILIPVCNSVEFLKKSIHYILYHYDKNCEIIIGVNGHPKYGKVYHSILNFVSSIQESHRKLITVLDLHTIKHNVLNEMLLYASIHSSNIIWIDVDRNA